MKPSFLQSALPVVLFAVIVSASRPCVAQAAVAGQTGPGSQGEDLHGLRVVPVPVAPTPTPFPLDVSTGRVQTLEFRTPEQMTTGDRELAASAQAEIARRAGLQGFRLDGNSGAGGWGYEQAVCPAFPEHLLLEYSRMNGPGDITLFSAVVPRAEGHVRVIPIQRRSYSLFTPVSSNALTLNDFNHMVTEGREGLNPDWLTLSLCYTALAGGHVRAALQAMKPTEESYPLLAPAKLSVSRKGGAAVYVVDTNAPARKAEWLLTFAQSGRLLKVRRIGPSELVETPVRGNATEVTGVPTKESAIDVGKPGN